MDNGQWIIINRVRAEPVLHYPLTIMNYALFLFSSGTLLNKNLFSRQFFYPPEAIHLYHGDEALGDLIRLEDEKRDGNAPLENERRQDGERQHETPHEYDIVEKHEIRFSAAGNDAAQARRLIRRADDGDGKDIDERIGEQTRLLRNIVKPDDRVFDEQQHGA